MSINHSFNLSFTGCILIHPNCELFTFGGYHNITFTPCVTLCVHVEILKR